jgi:transcriptional regulator with XRE-family HTH domain
MDLSPSYLSAAIARNNEPRAEFAYKVAKKFGVSLYWLIAGEDENAIDVKFAPVIKNDRVMEIAYNLHKCSEDFVAIIEQLVAYENSRAKRA